MNLQAPKTWTDRQVGHAAELDDWISQHVEKAKSERKRLPPYLDQSERALRLVVPFGDVEYLRRMYPGRPASHLHVRVMVVARTHIKVYEADRVTDRIELRLGRQKSWRGRIMPVELEGLAADTYLVLRGDGMRAGTALDVATALEAS